MVEKSSRDTHPESAEVESEKTGKNEVETTAPEPLAADVIAGPSRRAFLGGLGATVATGLVGFGGMAKAVAEPWLESASMPWKRPMLGALYEPGHRRAGKVWSRLRVKPGPYLGAYDSGDPGVVDVHRIWAGKYGLDFFLVAHRGDSASAYQWKNTGRLIATATRDGFPRVAIQIERDAVSRALQTGLERGAISHEAYVDAMARWFLERYDAVAARGWFEQRSYLSGRDGRRVLGVRLDGDARLDVEALAKVYRARPRIAETHWLWYAGNQTARENTRAIHGLLKDSRGAWFPAAPLEGQGWSESRRLYDALGSTLDQRVVSVSPAPAEAGDTLEQRQALWLKQLEELRQLRLPPTHLVINSFNDWASRNAIEPTGRSRPVYMEALRSWRRTART